MINRLTATQKNEKTLRKLREGASVISGGPILKACATKRAAQIEIDPTHHSQLTIMIIRIVRMHFTQTGVDEFLRIFRANEQAIRNFDGCMHLELLRDLKDETVYTTLSHWRDEESLERYRKSELFASVWSPVKSLFAERPKAFSLVKIEGLLF